MYRSLGVSLPPLFPHDTGSAGGLPAPANGDPAEQGHRLGMDNLPNVARGMSAFHHTDGHATHDCSAAESSWRYISSRGTKWYYTQDRRG